MFLLGVMVWGSGYIDFGFHSVYYIHLLVIYFILPPALGIVLYRKDKIQALQRAGKGLLIGGAIGFALNLFDFLVANPVVFPHESAPIGLFNIFFMAFNLFFIFVGFILSVVPSKKKMY